MEGSMTGKHALHTSHQTARERPPGHRKRRRKEHNNQQNNERNEQQRKEKLPDDVWEKILEDVDDNSVTAFASVCKQLRRVQQRSGRELKTNLKGYTRRSWCEEMDEFDRSYFVFTGCDKKELTAVSEDWCLWNKRKTHIPFQIGWSWSGKDRTELERKMSIQIISAALFSGHLAILKQLTFFPDVSEAELFHADTFAIAASGGHLEVVQYLEENGCSWDCNACFCAVEGGHLKVLEFLRNRRCPGHEKIIDFAASIGQLNVLKYARQNGWQLDSHARDVVMSRYFGPNYPTTVDAWIPAYAAAGGHLEVLKYLRELQYPWDEKTCEYAAAGGHLEVLKYAHENGCPWDIARFRHNSKVKGLRLREEVLAYLETLGDQSSDVESTSHSDSEPF